MSVLDMMSEFSLDCPELIKITGVKRVSSFSSAGVKYMVSFDDQTCTCPDFDQRGHCAVNNFSRWCKHLVNELNDARAFEKANLWQQAFANDGNGGPVAAYWLRPPKIEPIVLTVGHNLEWINAFVATKRVKKSASDDVGRIKCYGWHIPGKRWSYGEAPPGAREIRKVLMQIEGIEPTY